MKAIAAMAALLAPALLAACTGSGGKAGLSGPLAGNVYVAMGSSMAAGPGLGPPKPDTPERCTRSFVNYPTLLAERLRMTLYDVTCSGATTDNILAGWEELPAQIDAVTPETRLVSVTIGGNDLNYVGNLLAANCGPDGTIAIADNTFQCPAAVMPTEDDFARVDANLREIARQVKLRAPRARLVFVEYLRLVPDSLCEMTPITEEAAAHARATAERLASITQAVARETGSLIVPVHELSKKHTPCGAEPWAVGNPPVYDGADGAPWHPNAAGMQAVAAMVADRIGGR